MGVLMAVEFKVPAFAHGVKEPLDSGAGFELNVVDRAMNFRDSL